MKGASAEPWTAASSAPSSTKRSRMGSSQSFLRSRMNAHSSRTRVIELIRVRMRCAFAEARDLDLALERAPGRVCIARRARVPVAVGVRLACDRTATEGAAQPSGRRDGDQVEYR